jgi:hypothetical protein
VKVLFKGTQTVKYVFISLDKKTLFEEMNAIVFGVIPTFYQMSFAPSTASPQAAGSGPLTNID